MKSKIVKFWNGNKKEIWRVAYHFGANTNDVVFDFKELCNGKHHPVYRLGNTNICFEKETQKNLHKVIKRLK